MARAFPATRAIGRGLLWLARAAAVIVSLALLGLPFQHGAFLSVRPDTAPNQELIPGLFKLLMQPWLSAVLALAMVAFLIARIRLIPENYSRLTDMVYLGVVATLLATLQALAYLPVLLAPPV